MLLLIEALVLNYAVFSYVVFALAALGLAQTSALGVGLFAATAGSFLIYRKYTAFDFIRPSRAELTRYLLIIAACLVLYFHVVFLPPYIVDDLVYHLYVPQQMARTGGLYFSGLNLNTNFPMLFEFPLVLVELLDGPSNLGNLFFVSVLALLIYEVGRRFTKTPEWALRLCVLAVLTTPIIYDLVRSVYVEIFLTVLLVLAMIHYLSFQTSGSRRHWIWCCVWLGLACATRYTALYCAAVVVAWEFFRKTSSKTFYTGLLVAGAACLPWYLKNLVLTGNPFFPMANAFFPSAYLSDLRAVYYGSLLSGYNSGREIIDYLLLPLRVLSGHVAPPAPQQLGFGGQLSLFFALAMLGLNFKSVNRRFISVMSIGFIAIWVMYSQQVRFLPTFLIVPILFGAEWLFAQRRFRTWMFVVVVVAALVQNAWNASRTFEDHRIGKLLSGDITRDQFLAHHLPGTYDFAKEVNALTNPQSDRIFSVGVFGRSYYFDAPMETNTYYDAEVVDIAFDRKTPSLNTLNIFLKEKSISHLLFDWAFYRKYQSSSGTVDMLALESFFAQNFVVVARRGELVLYDVKPKSS